MQAKRSFELTVTMKDAARRTAAEFGCSDALHECDQLLGGFIHRSMMTPEAAAESFIRHGYGDAAKAASLVKMLDIKPAGKILEFAAGYGRVTRHLQKLLPHYHVFASDIHPEACDFITRNIGITALQSSLKPGDTSVGSAYDLIFVLSLFSHLPAQRFAEWLVALYSALSPGGYLMFTTHGQAALVRGQAYFEPLLETATGFGFKAESEQLDLDQEEYGVSIAMPRFVAGTIEHVLPQALYHSFNAGTWFGLQDEWIVQKPR